MWDTRTQLCSFLVDEFTLFKSGGGTLHCKRLQDIPGSLQVFPVVGKPCQIYRLRGNPIIIMKFSPQSVNITGFFHNIYRVSL